MCFLDKHDRIVFMKGNRIEYLDIAKAVAIIFVIARSCDAI